MGLLDKALGIFAASGRKRSRSGLSASGSGSGSSSSSSGRHLLAAEDKGANGSTVSPRWCSHGVFSPSWALGDVKAESTCWENKNLVSSTPSPRPPLPVLSPLALCLLLSRWDGVRDPVHKHRLHSQYVLLSGHIKLWKEVKYKSISGENTSPYQIQTNETDQRLNQPRGQGNIRVNKKVITYLQRKTWTETSKYVLYGAKKRRQIETPAECFYQDAWKADFKRNKHTVIGWVCPLVYCKKAWLVNVRLFNP